MFRSSTDASLEIGKIKQEEIFLKKRKKDLQHKMLLLSPVYALTQSTYIPVSLRRVSPEQICTFPINHNQRTLPAPEKGYEYITAELKDPSLNTKESLCIYYRNPSDMYKIATFVVNKQTHLQTSSIFFISFAKALLVLLFCYPQ